MAQKVIITVAPTGSISSKKDNPNLPVTPEEIAAETLRSYNAGATVVHLHARDQATGNPTSDINVFRAYLEGIRKSCPIITQITTGGGATTLGLPPEGRLKPVEELLPDSASLNAGSMNFGRRLFPNLPEVMELFCKRMKELNVMPEFEVYDLSMIQNVDVWIRQAKLLDPPYRFSYVMGVIGGIPPTQKNLINLVESAPKDCSWQTIGIGRHQFLLGAAGVMLGGGVRVGFEDNIYLSRGVLAKSNAELVDKMVKIIHLLGYEVATLEDAKQTLPLLNKK